MAISAGIAGVASAGSSILGGIMGGNAAKKAAAAQAAAIQQGVNFEQGVYNTAQTNLAPYLSGGTSAFNTLLGFFGLGGPSQQQGAQAGFNQFTQTPFYQFPLQQGQLALNRQLAASGLSQSGAALRDASQLNQGFASQGLQSYLGGLSGIGQQGQQAAGTIGQIGQNVGSSILQGYTGIGNANAAGIMGQWNQLSQGIQNAIGPLRSLLGGTINPTGTSYTQNGGGLIGGIGNWLNNWTSGIGGPPGGNPNYGGIFNGTVSPAGGLT